MIFSKLALFGDVGGISVIIGELWPEVETGDPEAAFGFIRTLLFTKWECLENKSF